MNLAELPRDWDVVVVGAGVAGSMAAYRLAKHGLGVLLVEKSSWPRDKACGGCVNAAALGVFRQAGLAGIEQVGQGYSQMRLASGRRRALLPLPSGRAISRRTLDARLVDYATGAGAVFVDGTQALLGASSEQGREVCVRHGHQRITLSAKLILACDGLGSRLLREEAPEDLEIDDTSPIGISTVIEDASSFYEPGMIHMACGTHGYVGLVRVEEGRLSIGAALDPGWMKQHASPFQAIAEVLNGVAFPLIATLSEADWRGTPRLTRRRNRLGSERVLVVGDAASYVEPFTGEGMGWALAGVMAIEPLALAAVMNWRDELVQRWTMRHAELFRARQRRCRGIAWLLRHPRWISALLPLIDTAPAMVAPLTARLNRQYRLLGRGG